MAKVIKLTLGKFAIVDDEDFEWLNQWKWYAAKGRRTFYVYRGVYSSKPGKRTTIRMHRAILGIIDPNIFVDHKDRNGLNNKRDNLRLATDAQNKTNRESTKGATSKYLGVFLVIQKYKEKTYRYWVAQISKYDKNIHLGYFKTEQEAALAYNKAAIKLHGEFANLNILQ